MDIENLIEQLSARGLSNGSSLGYHSGLFEEAATACGLKDEICPLYEERSIEWLEQEIMRLKQQHPPEGEEDTDEMPQL